MSALIVCLFCFTEKTHIIKRVKKAVVVAIPALKPNGKLIMIVNNNDKDLIGSEKYKALLHLLKIIGAKQFNHLILSLD